MNSVKESNEEHNYSLGETDVAELKDSITIIQKYEDIIKTQKKKVISQVAKQGHILKRVKDTEQLFEAVCHSKSTVYFKTNLCKFISKYPVLEKSKLLSHHF